MEPITRKEKFLAAAGGQNVDLPTPVTREEVFLKAIAEGGGGGGSDGDVFVCTFSQAQPYGTITCDKTIAEIASAYEAGKAVIGIAKYTMVQGSRAAGTAILNLVNVQYLDPATLSTPNYVGFSAVAYAYDDIENVHYYEVFTMSGNLILTANIWTANMNNIPMPTSSDNGKTYRVVNGELALVDVSPLIVTYTVSGQPSGNIYPLTSDHTISEIAAAYAAGKEAYAQLTISDVTATIPYFVRMTGSGYIATTINFVLNGELYYGEVNQSYDSSTEIESSQLIMIPINTLAINQ